jgi:hypothetical protein
MRDNASRLVSPWNPWGARGRKFESSRPDQLLTVYSGHMGNDDPAGPLWSHPWSQSEMRVAERRFVQLLLPADGAATTYDRTSRDSSGEISNVRILTRAERMKASIPAVNALPMRSQMTFGGAPLTSDRLRKSSSLEITAKPCSRAYAQIS